MIPMEGDWQTNSPCQHLGKSIKNSVDRHTDVWVQTVKSMHVYLQKLSFLEGWKG